MIKLDVKSIETELWREYEFPAGVGEFGQLVNTKYRIENPVQLITREGGTTHRVVDADGVVHCVPAVGQGGCVLRWKSKPDADAVAF